LSILTFTRVASFILVLGFFFSCTSSQLSLADSLEGQDPNITLEKGQEAIVAAPDSPDGYHMSGIAYMTLASKLAPEQRSENYQNMRNSFDSALSRYKSNTPSSPEIARIDELILQKWTNEHNSAASLFTTDSTSYRNRLNTAIAHAKNATIIRPNHRISFELLSDIHLKRGSIDGAIEAMEAFTSNSPEVAGPAYERIGFLHAQNGNYLAASEWYLQAIDWHKNILNSTFTSPSENESGSMLNTYHGAINVFTEAGQTALVLEHLFDIREAFPDIKYYNDLILEHTFISLSESYSDDPENGLDPDKVASALNGLFIQIEHYPAATFDAGVRLYDFALSYIDPQLELNESYTILSDDNALTLLQASADILQKALEANQENVSITQTLVEIYTLLGDEEAIEALTTSSRDN
jgi:tetratricopeptide (TPR) repeat protein